MNIVEIILKLLGSGDTVSKIASLLGIGQDQTNKAVGAAVPALLASLMGLASKPEGASQLSNVLSTQDPGLLGDLDGLLSRDANSGVGSSNPLTSLLGSAGLGQIAGALSKFTGVGEDATSKLLGLLGPVVLGAIGKQSKGLDAGGLASMLMGQKANITSAMPAGLGNILASAVPGLGSVFGVSPQTASSPVPASAATSGPARHVESTSSPMTKFLIPLILLGLAVFLLPKMCRKTTDAVSDTAQSGATAATGAIDATTDSSRFVSDVSGLISDATTTVATIKDEATATSALPKLSEINAKLSGMRSLWAKLPGPAQKIASSTLRPLIANLREALQPVLALPVVGSTLQPVVDEMLSHLDGFLPTA